MGKKFDALETDQHSTKAEKQAAAEKETRNLLDVLAVKDGESIRTRRDELFENNREFFSHPGGINNLVDSDRKGELDSPQHKEFLRLQMEMIDMQAEQGLRSLASGLESKQGCLAGAGTTLILGAANAVQKVEAARKKVADKINNIRGRG